MIYGACITGFNMKVGRILPNFMEIMERSICDRERLFGLVMK